MSSQRSWGIDLGDAFDKRLAVGGVHDASARMRAQVSGVEGLTSNVPSPDLRPEVPEQRADRSIRRLLVVDEVELAGPERIAVVLREAELLGEPRLPEVLGDGREHRRLAVGERELRRPRRVRVERRQRVVGEAEERDPIDLLARWDRVAVAVQPGIRALQAAGRSEVMRVERLPLGERPREEVRQLLLRARAAALAVAGSDRLARDRDDEDRRVLAVL